MTAKKECSLCMGNGWVLDMRQKKYECPKCGKPCDVVEKCDCNLLGGCPKCRLQVPQPPVASPYEENILCQCGHDKYYHATISGLGKLVHTCRVVSCDCSSYVLATSPEPTAEELKRFWEWCGLKIEQIPYRNNGDFSDLTLDNLFRYAVPKLQDKGFSIVLKTWEHKGFECSIESVTIMDLFCVIKSDKPELALFRAILEVTK